MWITTEQAIEIYGRFCRARYRGDALTVVMKRASELRKVGDSDGERVWNRWLKKSILRQRVRSSIPPRKSDTQKSEAESSREDDVARLDLG